MMQEEPIDNFFSGFIEKRVLPYFFVRSHERRGDDIRVATNRYDRPGRQADGQKRMSPFGFADEPDLSRLISQSADDGDHGHRSNQAAWTPTFLAIRHRLLPIGLPNRQHRVNAQYGVAERPVKQITDCAQAGEQQKHDCDAIDVAMRQSAMRPRLQTRKKNREREGNEEQTQKETPLKEILLGIDALRKRACSRDPKRGDMA